MIMYCVSAWYPINVSMQLWIVNQRDTQCKYASEQLCIAYLHDTQCPRFSATALWMLNFIVSIPVKWLHLWIMTMMIWQFPASLWLLHRLSVTRTCAILHEELCSVFSSSMCDDVFKKRSPLDTVKWSSPM